MSAARTALICTALALLAAPAAAQARWAPASSSAQGYSKSQQLAAGNQPTATVAGRRVTVSWTAPGGGAPASGYVVKRYDGSGTVQAIGSACSAIVNATTCDEDAVPAGTWRYTVTPANANWRGGESSASAAVVVGSPALSLDSSTITTLPDTLSGQITNFAGSQTVSFRLDNATGGTVLTGSITPSPVPASGTATVSVTIPSGTSSGSHTIYAVGSGADVAGATATVLAPQTVTTTAWDLRDASSGTEANASDPIAFAADGRTQVTTAPATAFSGSRYLLVDYDEPLPTNATPSSAGFDFRFASASSLSTACFYFDVRRASTDAILATHGSSSSPVGCVSNTTLTGFSTTLPEVSTQAIANDLRVRVYLRDSLSAAPTVDQATVSTATSQGSFTLYDNVFTDRVNTGTTSRTWPLVASAGTTYRSASTWSSSFTAGRYLKLTFPTYVPSGATVTSASFSHRYRSNGGGSVCWYFEVLQGSTVIGTHGSAASPINCNASTSTYQQDTISLPEIDTQAKANAAVIKIYMRNASNLRSQTDLAGLALGYSN